MKPKRAVQQGMAGGPGVRDACLVQGSCLCPAERERQPGAGQPRDLGIGLDMGNGGLGSSCSSRALSSWCSPGLWELERELQ